MSLESYFGLRQIRLRTKTYVVVYFAFGSEGTAEAAGEKTIGAARAARLARDGLRILIGRDLERG
jgi:hypothetical protein